MGTVVLCMGTNALRTAFSLHLPFADYIAVVGRLHNATIVPLGNVPNIVCNIKYPGAANNVPICPPHELYKGRIKA